MLIKCSYSKLVPISELKEHPQNRNKHPDSQIARLAKLIEHHGIRHPIIVSNRSGYIVAGHGRLRAFKKLKLKEVPIDFQDFKDEQEEYTFVQSDNSIALWAELSQSDILSDIEKFPELDLELLGFEELIQKQTLEPKCDEDEVPEVKEPRTVLGDIYEIGNHRVMCGDSTMIDNVDKLMNGQKADMVFTDPPYGVDYDGGIQFTKDGVKKGQRVKLDNDDSANIYSNVIPVLVQFVDGPIYTWYAASKGKQLYDEIDSLGEYHAMIIWVKDGGYGALNACYKQKHEPCVFWKPKGKTLRWDGPTTECTIWEIKKDKINKLHPTQKPVELAERAITNHKAESVLDLFLGSGSTLIACEKTGRKCYGMELDPHYCDVIVSRYVKYTGNNKIKLNGNDIVWQND